MSVPSRRARGGVALLVALMIVVIGAFAAAAALSFAGAASRETDAANRVSRARLAADSGLRGVMAEFAAQRDAVLAGAEPDLTPAWIVDDSATGRRTVVRLVAIAPDGPLATPEAAWPGLYSFPETASWLGIDASELATWRAPNVLAPEDLPGFLLTPARRVSLCAVEPEQILGLDDSTEPIRGDARLGPGDTLDRAVSLPEPLNAFVRTGLSSSSGEPIADRSSLIARLRAEAVPPEQWGAAIDLLATSTAEWVSGRLDLNYAPAEALALVPGLDEATADAIVGLRERTDAADRRSPAWVVAEGVVTPSQFEQAAPWLTTVSLQWRVRLEAGEARPADLSAFEGIGGIDPELELEASLADADLEYAVTLEAVIDLSTSPPRLAYLAERGGGRIPSDADREDVRVQIESAGPVVSDASADRAPLEPSDDAGSPSTALSRTARWVTPAASTPSESSVAP